VTERALLDTDLRAAVSCYKAGDLAGAEARCRKILAADPDRLEALDLLGLAASERGAHEVAIGCFERAVAKAPTSAVLYDRLGTALKSAGRFEQAVAAYDRALQLDPRFVAALNNRGVALEILGRVAEAVATYRNALSIAPNVAEVHANVGSALKELCEFDQAVAHYRRALELSPGFTRAHSALLFCLNYHPQIGMEELFEEYKAWNERHAEPLRHEWVPHDNERDPNRRLRIAYFSPDLRQHSVRHFAEPLFLNYNSQAFEFYCYADIGQPDSVTRRFQDYFHHWVDVAGMSDAAMAAHIRADGIDVLVDLAGHSAGNRLLVFARKPAPVQVSWLGYGYTSGLRAIDYFLATDSLVPAGCEQYFSEAIYRLPRTPYCYLPPPNMPDVEPLPARQKGFVTFACFSRSLRLNDRVVETWCRILQAIPKSILMLNCKTFVDPAARSLFASRFKRCGVDPDRVKLVFTTPQTATWAAYNTVDIALDPFPHNAGTTTVEALWMGVPVLTLAARPPLGTIGATVLGLLGMNDWIAKDEGAYVRIAVQASRDLQTLGTLRNGLRKRMEASALCDGVTFARDVEHTLRNMWRRWCATPR